MLPRLVAAAALLALVLATAPAVAKPRAAKRLASFGSCAALVGYASRHVPPAPAGRGQPPTSAPMPLERGAGDDTSQTNVQEAGVDEPDIVKTDGRTIFALANGMLHAVDARSPAPRLLGTLQLDHGWGATLLLREGRAFLLGGGPRGARMTEVDVSDPARMKVLRTEDVDGYIVDARLTGHSARVVVASYPDAVDGPAELRARPSGWLPTAKLRNARTGKAVRSRAVGCRSVRRPAVFSGPGVLTVYTLDLARGLPAVDADAVFTSADTVYASQTSLYVATQRWEDGLLGGANSSIHRFDTSNPDRTRYGASGAVPGTLLNQFALSEHRGVLRAATTVGFGAEAESRVTTLDRRDGHLVRRGDVGGLGRGERIYAVRFFGDVGYVVTFRQVDPLYTLDLSDPDRPRVAGELKIPGYSAYLHPVGGDLLLGVGQEATAEGRLRGLQLSLFDVSDPARPARLQQARLGDRWSHSAAEWDHHAFLWWPPAKLAVLPIDSEGFSGAAGFSVDRAGGIAEVGRVSHDEAGARRAPSISRAVVVGPRLFTISDSGVKASGLNSFAAAGWAAFPQPPEPPGPEPLPVR
jgi:uncharacterized secreted protein with C-terminal beta-propeller domain